MRYQYFTIRNFKGIQNATLRLNPSGANIFTLIGLNESGKTSILEAINAFKPDIDQASMLKPEVTYNAGLYIPKDKQANFTDNIEIETSVEFDLWEIWKELGEVEKKFKCKINSETIDRPLIVVKTFQYEDSELVKGNFVMHLHPKVKLEGARRYTAADGKLWSAIADVIRDKMPDILYFPTFLFSIPERIDLNVDDNESRQNAIYRKIISDVANSLPNPIDLQKHVIDRMVARRSSKEAPFVLLGGEQQMKAEAALNDISQNISETIFTGWQKVLGSKVRGREISLRPGLEIKHGKPSVFVKFMMRDGGKYFDISERSLGFRWYFSFLLFTMYRATGRDRGDTIFLLDEPASNLHSKAQMELLESFPRIASGNNVLIYSTHSHYMINPSWLEQAYIVENRAIEAAERDERDGVMGSHPTNIKIAKYRSFVGANPDKITYFQPVLDQLNYAPSRLELRQPSILLEGKGDYAILEYVRTVVQGLPSSPAFVGTRGATGMDELIGLFLGWGVPFCVCLDDDKEGVAARDRYRRDWGLPEDQVFTLGEVDAKLGGKSVEGLLAKEDVAQVARAFSVETVTKSQVRLYYSEALAARRVDVASEHLCAMTSKLIQKANTWLGRSINAGGMTV